MVDLEASGGVPVKLKTGLIAPGRKTCSCERCGRATSCDADYNGIILCDDCTYAFVDLLLQLLLQSGDIGAKTDLYANGRL